MTCPICHRDEWQARRQEDASALVVEAYYEWRRGATLAQAEMLRDAAANLAHHLAHLTAERAP